MLWYINKFRITMEKNGFAKNFKNLTRYRSENNFIELNNYV